MEDSGLESIVDYDDLTQRVSERKNIIKLTRGHSLIF